MAKKSRISTEVPVDLRVARETPFKEKRHVVGLSPEYNAALDALAERLDMSKVGALGTAIAVLAKITQEIDQGGELVIRKDHDQEQAVWIPLPRRGNPHGEARV